MNESDVISIHSPRKGRDDWTRAESPTRTFQSTRPARGETMMPWSMLSPRAFQSTRPARGETVPALCAPRGMLFQSTRPARGETLTNQSQTELLPHFNPLAPQGARPPLFGAPSPPRYFNPLAPQGARRTRAQ